MSALPRTDTGGVGLLVVLGGTLLYGVALALLAAVADLHVSAARARTAADAAALAAVGASPLMGGRGDACEQARRAAEANDAALTSCRTTVARTADGGLAPAVEVRVEVDPRSPLVRRSVGRRPAHAAAALRPRQPPDLP